MFVCASLVSVGGLWLPPPPGRPGEYVATRAGAVEAMRRPHLL
jgi:hypothetical protein